MQDLRFSGIDSIIILLAYAVIMVIIGWLAGRGENIGKSVSKYYLAGRNLGIITLFFTLYATQYSGNTIIGYAPQAYREGFSWIQSVPMLTIVIGVYLLYAPRLYTIAKKAKFITPTDWVRYRFQSKQVTILAIILMLWGIGNFFLEQIVAIGTAVSGLTGGTIPYGVAVIGFIIVMLTYEWLGGMKAVATTDVLQGSILLIGVIVMLIGGITLSSGGATSISENIAAIDQERIGVPDLFTNINWISMIVLAGFGAALYPQAIQRIYSTKSERTFKKSLARLAWMPPITVGVVFILGIIAIQLYPGLSVTESEEIIGLLANDIADLNLFYYWMMIIFFGAIVGAIVSTADSVLLSFSSIISHDVYGKYINSSASEKRKIKVGKLTGIVLVGLILWIAWNPPGTLYQIFVLKLEFLIQLVPVFILGLYWKRLSSGPVFWGMLIGAIVAAGMTIAGYETVFGIHGGLYGLTINIIICVVGSLMIPMNQEKRKKAEILTAIKTKTNNDLST
ncbi:sodium:solute symporter family protein [Salicibibacter cibi]|uniref:Sodium:solute symporter family protein n=1 Tax=Salicibibacter cibi TaxID=2743001 RepID=A0A7T6Z886_9BACI|nr:sodium:solute symporter family protein [Salicibibacter cibi]QQK78655.1 sodium:solute symporter family protein [Salicibibacter cibi]